jgi:hypothetical protein
MRRSRFLLRATTALAALAWLMAVTGCDPTKGAYEDAAQLEAAGSFHEAAIAYRRVCAAAPPSRLCTLAGSRAVRLDVRAGWQAAQQGRYDAAKLLLDAAVASNDAQARQAANAILHDADVVQGLAWEAASRITDKTAARAAIEAIADTDTVVAAKARDWLDENGLELLLGDVAAACAKNGKGSCVELGRKLATEASTPAVDASKRLVAAEWARVRPLLIDAEKMLETRAALHAREQKVLGCIARTSLAEDYAREDCERHVPTTAPVAPAEPTGPTAPAGARARPLAAAHLVALPTAIDLFTTWRAQLEAIHDALGERRARRRLRRAELARGRLRARAHRSRRRALVHRQNRMPSGRGPYPRAVRPRPRGPRFRHTRPRDRAYRPAQSRGDARRC